MSFLRKASQRHKDDGRPGSRSVSSSSKVSTSDAPGLRQNGDHGGDGKVKRKNTLAAKGKKRLSSLFSSSSLSTMASDRDPSTSPDSRPQSHLNTSTTSSSSEDTPGVNPTRNVNRYPGLGARQSSANSSTAGMGQLSLGTHVIPPMTDSPPSSSLNTSPSPVASAPTRSVDQSVTSTPPGAVRAAHNTRPESLYSQWTEDEDTSDEVLSFRTPSEGLSEVEELDEDEDRSIPPPKTAHTPAPAAAAAAAVASTAGAADTATATATAATTATQAPVAPEKEDLPVARPAPGELKKGAVAPTEDIVGTGPSTIHRTNPGKKTEVVRHLHPTKDSAFSVDQTKSLAPDLEITREGLTLFLTSRMKDAEAMVVAKNPDANHMYLLHADGILQALKGMMTFDATDLNNALEISRGTAVVSAVLRRPTESLASRLGGFVRSGGAVARVKAMSVLERHAELVHAETSLMKALLAIVAGGDWLGMIREALNMRSAHATYRVIQQFIEESDANGFDEDIDMDFRSGVLLGTGTSSLMLSLLPGKVLKIAEVFGYAGDRDVALATLMSAGGWHAGAAKPDFDQDNEGLRRPICDLILLAFYLVISVLMPVAGVDIGVARNILEYNMERYPDGIFFLYFQARLHTSQCEPEKANASLQRALELSLEYVQLQHMCLWDYGVNFLMFGNWKGALDCFAILKDESNWSRAVYTYSAAACLVELISDSHPTASVHQANLLMSEVPKLTKKIAGKSLPIEKLCSRKTRKFESQNHTLFLPAVELAYVFGSLGHAPRGLLLGVHLPRIDRMLGKLEGVRPEEYGNGHEYWDDYCLGHFLRGVVLASARYQPPEATPEARKAGKGDPSDEDIDAEAERDLKLVLGHGPKVELDHYIIYHCHYELGKLYAARNDVANARKNFDIVMTGKVAEGKQYQKTQGKYSLEGALLLKTHSALQALKEKEAK